MGHGAMAVLQSSGGGGAQALGAGGTPGGGVVAVQLVSQRSGSRGSRTTYQLNLVLFDDELPRLCLSNDNYWDAARANGAILAAFLGVPLLDEVSINRSSDNHRQ
jgi:hypothetical protein